ATALSLPGEGPAAVLDITAHRLDREAERLLVVRGNPGVDRGAHGAALPGQKPPPALPRRTPCFTVPSRPPRGGGRCYPFRPGGSADSAGFQRSGNSSSIRLFGCVLTRPSTSRR